MTSQPSDLESSSASVARHRSESLKCSVCAFASRKAKKINMFTTMKRLYIKDKNGWKTVGWYCRWCGSIVLDRLVKPGLSFSPIPEPKITILNNENL
jgi:hypothetical protein